MAPGKSSPYLQMRYSLYAGGKTQNPLVKFGYSAHSHWSLATTSLPHATQSSSFTPPY